ncbi:MAG: HNH endonuclease signature motif containing protein [Candidatus Berkelbacteria bacterium]|nr:HNH endonuclease signature motif containing protein [Candidatus Berkelbacteria bacterium]
MKTKRWTESQLKDAAADSTSIRQVLSRLNLKAAGGNYKQISKYIEFFKIDNSHFTGKLWSKGKKLVGKPRISIDKILVKNSSYQSYKLKRRLFNLGLKKQVCEDCGWSIITDDGRIPLEVHRMNGDSKDNRLENLEILCPNCHSLRPNYRGRNIK